MMYADTPAVDPAGRLYDAGIRQTEEGKFEVARTTLQSLVDSYPKDPLALQAKGAIDATLLFEEGQARTKAGKYETARLAFETLIAVYPENPLAQRAKSAVEAIAEKEGKSQPVVKAVEFRDVQKVPVAEIQAAMEAREIRLSVGKPCRPRDIEQAKVALEAILAEKGMANVRVQAQTRAVPPDSVDVIFTVEKARASLLLSPWRLAMAGWHRVRPATDGQNSGL
jgi:outer membrane protein assembly factor BamD (BamD/ComL family)